MRTLFMMALAATPLVAMADQQIAMNVTPPPADPVAKAATLPTDPLQRIAYRAVVLREWPKAPQWKLDAYQEVLDKGITSKGAARRTSYCPSCSGTRCADGSRVRHGICAASKNIPMHSIIWLAGDGLLKVTDRGGAVKPHPRHGESAHFDVWQRSCRGCSTGPGTRKRVPFAVIFFGGK
ncbi:MAG: hypothetical protein ABFD96_21960 [Armatimonadia bacterium]